MLAACVCVCVCVIMADVLMCVLDVASDKRRRQQNVKQRKHCYYSVHWVHMDQRRGQ